MVFDLIANSFGSVWSHLSDFIILISIIIYMVIFFVTQYFLIKGYIWIFKSVWNIPLVSRSLKSLFNDLISGKKPVPKVPQE